MDTKKPWPFPEVLPGQAGRHWKVRVPAARETPGTNPIQRQMIVPLDETEAQENIRRHELAHAMWSPKKHPMRIAHEWGVGLETLQKVEDFRMLQNLERTGIDMQAGYGEDKALFKFMRGWVSAYKAATSDSETKRLKSQLYLNALGVLGTKDYKEILTPLGEFLPTVLEALKQLTSAIDKALTDGITKDQLIPEENLKRAVKTATKWIEETASLPPPAGIEEEPDFDAEPETGGDQPSAFQTRSELAEYIQQLAARGDKNWQPSEYRKARWEDGDPEKKHRIGKGPLITSWGDFSIQVPPLVRDIAQILDLKKKPRSTDCGDTIRHMHRFMMDGMVFKKKTKTKSGTVLIDASGSMGFKHQHILTILKGAPATTIACYGGDSYETGVLRILAKDGKMCQDQWITSPGRANIVDGPALLWLAAQAKPRVWVSDGQVTGVNESTASKLYAEAALIVKHAQILRFDGVEPTVQAFAELIKKGIKLSKSPHRSLNAVQEPEG